MAHELPDGAYSARRPIPVPTDYTRLFWIAALAGELRLPRCPRCDLLFYPPPPRCPRCLGHQLAWMKLSGRGRIAGLTTVHLPTIPGVVPPFAMVEVELDEQSGLVITALLVPDSVDAPTIGDAVTIDFTQPDARKVAYPQFRILVGGAE